MASKYVYNNDDDIIIIKEITGKHKVVHMIPTRKLILKRLTTASIGKGLEHIGALTDMFKNRAPLGKCLTIFFIKLNIYLSRDTILSICKRNKNICLQRDLYINVHGSYVHNRQKLEPTQTD